MGFDYNSRRELTRKYYDKWESEHKKAIQKLDQKVYEKICNFSSSYYNTDSYFVSMVREKYKPGEKPSDFMKKNLGDFVDLFVPQNYIEDYYNIVDEYLTFQYTHGYTRRSFRTKDFSCHINNAIRLMKTYRTFGIFDATVSDYLRDHLSEELIDLKRKDYDNNDNYISSKMDDVIASRINSGDQEVIDAIKESILSENNTVVVSRSMISAIVKSKNIELHELLAKLLVAARLSEGIRQVICESADEGRIDSFVTLLKVIEQENLVRFAAVKRAFAVWTGFIDENNIDRIIKKILPTMLSIIEDLDQARELLKTNDSINIMLGLWALAANDVALAMKEMKTIAKDGTKTQKLTISYFNRLLQSRQFSGSVAQYVIENNPDDFELVAAFLPTYIPNAEQLVRCSFRTKGNEQFFRSSDEEVVYSKISLSDVFANGMDEQGAKAHYEILKKNLAQLKKKKMEMSPFIFPWYSITICRSDFVEKMALIAYALEDQKYIDETCQMLSDIDGEYSARCDYVRLLLHDPQNELQRKMLLSYICDRETYTRKTAFRLLECLELRADEYEILVGYLKYKSEDIRKYVMSLLKMQPKTVLSENIKTLLNSKNENMRLAGFDLLKTEFEEDKDFAKKLLTECLVLDDLSEQEKMLWTEICGENASVNNEAGYGIYDVDADLELPKIKNNVKLVWKFFSVSNKELDKAFISLINFITENGHLEYKDSSGETRLLANGLHCISHDNKRYSDSYPFKELWEAYYKEHIHSEKLILSMQLASKVGYTELKIKDYKEYRKLEKKLMPHAGSDYDRPVLKDSDRRFTYIDTLAIAVNIMVDIAGATIPREIALAACDYMVQIPEKMRWLQEAEIHSLYAHNHTIEYVAFWDSMKLRSFVERLLDADYSNHYEEIFYALRRIDLAYENQKNRKKTRYSYSMRRNNILSVYHFMYACLNGIITKDYLYKYIFEELSLEVAIDELNVFASENLNYSECYALKKFMKVDVEKREVDTSDPFYQFGKEIYDTVANLMLNVELKRGDTETEFSKAATRLKRVDGIQRLGEILIALGKDTLDRGTYYLYGGGTGKKECLSHLLQACYPLPEEKAADLKQIKVSKDRLIEVAMYAPQWLDLIEEFLDCQGFKSSCYYFMAHMNEQFDDKKKSIIAKYTPLSDEELNDGAFDLEWFFESYNQLGEKMFQKLYKAAKYISDGSKHSRARKYADAALGKVAREELERTILDKRNKDLLMSYGIIPVEDESDSLHRYEFIQEFLKLSRKFGAQRRASEKKACEMALKNLATTSGYLDSLRFTLAMETALVEENNQYFDGFEIENYKFAVTVSDDGKAELFVQKDGKKMKSVPAAYKKDERIIELKEFVTKLKNQYSRSVKMFESSMEESEEYSVKELLRLCRNPVMKAILTKLIFVKGSEFYRINSESEFVSAVSDAKSMLLEKDLVRVAHPYDMYIHNEWTRLQKLVFSWASGEKKYQPFKQVFRELYVKLSEESDATTSKMFAGNQIQPKKTVATLKNRRWIADYEDGLQKVYYKENVIATIYAMADWFAPSDVEEPTLEYVAFYDRKTFKEKKLSEISDILYSEVMRDVDLAVSVAHAGGVDPETSHSTVELRKTIIEFNLKLFKLNNVKLEGSHAFIEGTHGKYSVHLGSGMIHKLPGVAINVLPVHSQNRGKIFLPFIDEDPKTAEIMSKIIMLAQDQKIKDTSILEQILSC